MTNRSATPVAVGVDDILAQMAAVETASRALRM
jgi:hypothetical protein